MNYVFRFILCLLFLFSCIISIIFNYFIQIEIIDIISLWLSLHIALHVALCLQIRWLSLHIAGPSQCPLVDKPHPASVAGTRPAVAGCSRKEVAQALGARQSSITSVSFIFSHLKSTLSLYLFVATLITFFPVDMTALTKPFTPQCLVASEVNSLTTGRLNHVYLITPSAQ